MSTVYPYILQSFPIKNKQLISFTQLQLNQLNQGNRDIPLYDVAVIGGGIAGSTISWLLQDQYKLQVALIDPCVFIPGSWYPNYGEWRDEWHSLSDKLKLPELKDCTTTEWEYTDCFFGGSFDIPMEERTTLQRPYIRVDRIKMQQLLRDKFSSCGGTMIASKLDAKRISTNLFDNALVHDYNGSTLVLDDGSSIRCKLLIDATGLESRLVEKETPFEARGNNLEMPTGYQIAYGFIAHVDSLGPYDKNAMTLFDYRTDHISNSEKLKDVVKYPTFMYTMPLGDLPENKYRVFFEETSLVGKDDRRLSFEECKQRAMERLKYHNINVLGIEEEEFCYIPMGGELPNLRQRVIAFGGAANLVHPSTGYQACRMIAASTVVADAISKGIQSNLVPDAISADVYSKLWSSKNRLQRDFQAFGGDFLMDQNVENLRGFFKAFFDLDQKVWSGFLAGYPGLPNNEFHESWDQRLSFALQLFVRMPAVVALTMVIFSIKHTIIYGPNTLLRSLVPGFLFGEGSNGPKFNPSFGPLGDEEAKLEARSMMSKFIPTASSPVKLNSDHDGNHIPSPF